MPLSVDIVARVSRRLAEHAGLELPAWVVEARAAARMEELGCDAESYVELITTARGFGELTELVEAVRVGESSLFRHRQQIQTLVDEIVPALRAKRKRALSVWSAGCAAGQEPYTLAIVLSRALPGCHISVTATDVSTEALDAARANRFAASSIEDVPEEYRDAFELDGDELRVTPDIARCVRFEKRNLIERGMKDASGKFDLVWCRNVLIYFSTDARRRALDHLIDATASDGYIFVGYSESLRDVGELEAVRGSEAVYYKKKERPSYAAMATPTAGVPALRRTPPAGMAAVTPKLASPPIVRTSDVAALTSQLAARLAEHHARVVIDLDAIEVLDASLVPILRRASAAARAAGGELVLRATRATTRSWLARQGFEAEESA